MISVETVKKYASVVLLHTVEKLFDGNQTLIDNFYDDFVKTYENDKNLKKNFKDNEVVDELLIEELEKSFTQSDIGHTLQSEMVKENNKAIAELANILDEKLRPVAYELRSVFNDNEKYDEFRKLTTENLVVSNMNLNNAVIKAMKTMNISGMQSAVIMQLISQVDM